MDRLTKRLPDNLGCVPAEGIGWPEVTCRLAAYEDTGLEPGEVEACKVALMGKTLAEITEFEGIALERMIELAKAESEGRLIALPCKVGDTVWRIGPGIQQPRAIYPTKADKLQRIVMWMQCGDFGKTVFLTCEEAEAALEGRNDA